MFTCPNKDLHSVYLDNELAENYKAQYEKHINTCPKCQAELKKIKALRSLLKNDKDTISLTNNDISSSFERLQARMSYTRVTRKPLTLGDHTKNMLKDVVIGAAAAAVIAVILPLRSNTVIHTTDFQPVARMTSLELPVNFQLDENVSAENVCNFLSDNSPRAHSSALTQAHDSLAAAVMPFGTAVVNTKDTANVATPISLTSYDVFNPIQEEANIDDRNHGFFLHFSSSLFSLDIGNEK